MATILSALTPAGTYKTDLGVRDATTGGQLTLTTGTPTAGQYAVTTLGVYTFASADTTPKFISFTYTVAAGQSVQVTNKPMGAMPTFAAQLVNNQFGNNFKLKFPYCIATKLTLGSKNEDFTIPEFDFSAFSDPSGNLFYWDLDY